jgi:hypothetical protein
MSFETTMNKGFMMQFANGFRISVQWGVLNYCTRKNDTEDFNQPQNQDHWESATAEIAVFNKDGEMVELTSNDVVAGWLTTDEVAKVIAICSSASSDEEISKKVKSLNL